MLNGFVTSDSISIRIGSGVFFFLTLPALVTLTDLTLSEPTSTSPKLSDLGEILSLPTTGVGVAVGVAVAVAVGVGVAGVATTLKPSDPLDATSEPVPAKVADRVSIPVPLAVTAKVGIPCGLAAAGEVRPPAEKLIVSPGSTATGFCDTSVSD